MPVSDTHKLYAPMISRIEKVRDCVEGSDAIKSRRSTNTNTTNSNRTGIHNIAGSRYLPPPNPGDESIENQDRYRAYLQRANFVNFTAATKDGFMGMINRRKAEIDLVEGVDYLVANVNGAGMKLKQLINKTISELLIAGGYGLLADFPITKEGLTQAQTSHLVATAKQYPRESIINWTESVIDGVTTLTQVVLAEIVCKESPDGFSSEELTFHRVLFLDTDGVYKQNIYNEDDKLIFFADENLEPDPDIVPRKSDGSTWNIIPFVFAGSEANVPTPQKPVLYDLSEINISHYRNSADYEESSFMVGQPWPVISGLTETWVKEVLKDGIMIGSRAALLLPSDASAELLQASPNQMPSKGMEIKEEQMIKIGAKIIVDASGTETVEAVKIRFSGQNSKLAMVVTNAEDAILQVIEWLMEFMGATGDNILEVNRQFFDATVNPQLIIANIQLLDRGIVAKSDVRSGLRKSNVIAPDRTDDDIDEELENISPLV